MSAASRPHQPAQQLAQQLQELQLSWLLEQLQGPALQAQVERTIAELLQLADHVTVAELVTRDEVTALLRHLLAVVPASTMGSTVTDILAGLIHEGTPQRFALAELLDRENVDKLTTELLGATDLVEEALDGLTRSPMLTSLGARFVGRIVNDVMATNKAMAEKIPGVGALMSLGARSAKGVMGVADIGLEQVFGDTAARGALFLVRRLNKIIIDTLKDPATQAAVLELFDLYAHEPLPRLSSLMDRDDIDRLAGIAQDIVIAGAPTAPVEQILDALSHRFYDVYGDETVTTLLADLNLDEQSLLTYVGPIAFSVAAGALNSGQLEELLRARLSEFYTSPAVLDAVAAALST